MANISLTLGFNCMCACKVIINVLVNIYITYMYLYNNYTSLQIAKRVKTGSASTKFNEFDKKLKAKCNELGYSLGESKNYKTRNKKVVVRCFNKIGIVVPVDANDVGYRPLPMTNGMITPIHYTIYMLHM